MFTRKDLILLQKYKDDNYKNALTDSIISLAKYQIFRSAMAGDTMARVSMNWASNKIELGDLQKQEQIVRDNLKEIFRDSKIEVETNHINLLFYEFWEIVVKANWN